MDTITIDFNNVVLPNDLSLLKERTKPFPQTKLKLGLILLILKEQRQLLESIPSGVKRISYINTPVFVEAIQGYAYVIYDEKKKVCEIGQKYGVSLDQLSEEILGVFPNDSLIWSGASIEDVQFSEQVLELLSSGFEAPHVSNKSPSGIPFSSYGLCLVKHNDNRDRVRCGLKKVEYVLLQFAHKVSSCQALVKLTPDTVRYLRDLQRIGSTLNKDGTITQKEIAGNLECKVVDDNFVHHLSIDYDSLISGEEEGVPIAPGLYNFHSHPYQAYKKHKVKVGWPSAQDYVGYLIAFLEDNTILHMVTSIEGVYIISMTKYWLKYKAKLSRRVATFILENYNFCGVKDKDPLWYVRTVNTIKYEGYPLFRAQYSPWHEATEPFRVEYKKDKENCFVEEKTYKYYQQLYGK